MLVSVVVFALSICVEFYLVSRLILNSVLGSLLCTLGLLLLFVVMWFVLPRSEFLKTLFSGKDHK
jgi:phage shock protein PspC (stress-responsive transcriptional regulator)